MSVAVELAVARRERRSREIAAELRTQWRMIASVSLRPCRDGEGFEADVRLDPIIVSGSFEQQGYPRTPADLRKVEARRLAALEKCAARVSATLAEAERIRAVTVID